MSIQVRAFRGGFPHTREEHNHNREHREILDNKINLWLKSHPSIKIIDIKFQMVADATNTDGCALVIYDDGEPPITSSGHVPR